MPRANMERASLNLRKDNFMRFILCISISIPLACLFTQPRMAFLADKLCGGLREAVLRLQVLLLVVVL